MRHLSCMLVISLIAETREREREESSHQRMRRGRRRDFGLFSPFPLFFTYPCRLSLSLWLLSLHTEAVKASAKQPIVPLPSLSPLLPASSSLYGGVSKRQWLRSEEEEAEDSEDDDGDDPPATCRPA